jgi:uncharacterized protein (DUF305 family)
MPPLHRSRLGPALLAVWTAAGCATASPPRPAAADTAELEALYLARTDSARMRFTEADVRFVTDMIAHHAQALVMAELAPTHGARATIRTLAARIVNAQEGEIAWMEAWLRDRRQPVPNAASGGHAHEHLPGMITPDQLDALERASGPDFDRLFLTLMIQHHQGAVAMVNELLATDGAAQAPATFDLVSGIHVDQTTEIARMEQMLAALPPGDSR